MEYILGNAMFRLISFPQEDSYTHQILLETLAHMVQFFWVLGEAHTNHRFQAIAPEPAWGSEAVQPACKARTGERSAEANRGAPSNTEALGPKYHNYIGFGDLIPPVGGFGTSYHLWAHTIALL